MESFLLNFGAFTLAVWGLWWSGAATVADKRFKKGTREKKLGLLEVLKLGGYSAVIGIILAVISMFLGWTV
jgi:hypothetical protein